MYMRALIGQAMVPGEDALTRFGEWLQTQGLQWLATDGVAVLITAGLAWGALRFSSGLSSKLVWVLTKGREDAEAKQRGETLAGVIRWVLKLVVLGLAGMMVLAKLGVQIGPVIAAAGVVGLAVGYGAQTLVQDLITGFFLLLEDQLRVGDVVSLNGKAGLVERITLRVVVLREASGSVHYVRNGQIQTVTNMTKDYSRYVFDIGVAYRENVDDVMAVLKQIDEELRRDPAFKDDILAPLEVLGVDRFDSSAVVIKARTMTQPIKQWRVGREFNRRVKLRFDELGIEIPYPHLTLYPGVDKAGVSPALAVRVEGSGPHGAG
jgi:moderate conductance mechanosensitive channel